MPGRILEIGNRDLFQPVFPDATLLLWTGRYPLADEPGRWNLRARRLPSLVKDLRAGAFGIVVCHAARYAPWAPSWLVRQLAESKVVGFPIALLRSVGAYLALLPGPAPLVIVDLDDTPSIGRHMLPLMRRCRLYFKRELPADHWRVFFRSLHRDLPSPRLRRRADLQDCLAKLRPLSLGLGRTRIAAIGTPSAAKEVDLFFAGVVDGSSTVRRHGLSQLRALAAEGWRIDVADQRLPFDAFVRRCARARLAWVPEGLGWDTYRQYEAALAGAVPMMNYPTIERHRPLVDGEQCWLYDVSGDDLAWTVRRALADPARLAAMAASARDHVLAHHTEEALLSHVIAATRAAPAIDRRFSRD